MTENEINSQIKKFFEIFFYLLQEKEDWEIAPQQDTDSFVEKFHLRTIPYDYPYDLFFVGAVNKESRFFVVFRTEYEDGNYKVAHAPYGMTHEYNPEKSGVLITGFYKSLGNLASTKQYSLEDDSEIKRMWKELS